MKIIRISKKVIAQLWKTDHEDSFQGHLERLYELEYKYHKIKNSKFTGHPKSKENILNGFEKRLKESIKEISDVLESVFKDWLKAHALLDPQKWAETRVYDLAENAHELDMSSEESVWNYICSEFNRFMWDRVSFNNQETLSNAVFQYLIKEDPEIFSESLTIEKRDIIFDLYDEMSMYEEDSEEHQELEDKIDEIEKMTPLEFVQYCFEYGYTEIEGFLDKLFDLNALRKITEKHVFPIWLKYWEKQGIRETRDRIEKTYDIIKRIPSMPISKSIAYINYAINVSHQSGKMTDHIYSYLSNKNQLIDWDIFERLSEMDVTEWDEDLKKDPRIKTEEKPEKFVGPA